MLAGRGATELELLFGRAFLVAVGRNDRELAILFARAFLSQVPLAPHRGAA